MRDKTLIYIAHKDKILRDLSKIATEFGIVEFIKVKKGDHLCELNGENSYINRSYICGKDRIELGIYKDIELMIISFFHEIGHIHKPYKPRKFNKDTEYKIEKRAWKIGLELAKRYGYKFSNNTHKWVKKQLLTYKNLE